VASAEARGSWGAELEIRVANELWMLQADLGLAGLRSSVHIGAGEAHIHIQVPGRSRALVIRLEGVRPVGGGFAADVLVVLRERRGSAVLARSEGAVFGELGSARRYLAGLYNLIAGSLGLPRVALRD